MYRSGTVNKGTFHVELETDEGKVIELSVFSPKLRKIKNFEKLDEHSENSTEETAECIADFLSHNKESIRISTDDVLDIFDIEDMTAFVEEFFSWIAETKKK